jgi:hypothetical protein
MLLGRSGTWQSDTDGERGGNEHSGRHRVAELRTGVVSTASFSAKDTARSLQGESSANLAFGGRCETGGGLCAGKIAGRPQIQLRVRRFDGMQLLR